MTGGVVVVIGPTGRNFAAGMSGGVAYVLDEDGTFERRCNLSMIDLEPVEAEDEVMRKLSNQGGDLESHGLVDVMGDMTKQDAERLHQLIARHAHYTNSAKAKTILENWAVYQPKFKKVMPVDYRRALTEIAKHQAADPSGLEVIEIALVDARTADDRDRLSRADDALAVERIEVVDRREVVREDVVDAARRALRAIGRRRFRRCRGADRRGRVERRPVTLGREAAHRRNRVRERGRNLRVGRIRDALFGARVVEAHRGRERALDFRGGAAEADARAAVRDRIDVETLRAKPRADRVDVVLAGAEALADLARREPAVIVGRRRILLILQQLLERLLARIGALQRDRERCQRKIGRNGAGVVRRRDPSGAPLGERHALVGIDRLNDAVFLRDERRMRTRAGETENDERGERADLHRRSFPAGIRTGRQ